MDIYIDFLQHFQPPDNPVFSGLIEMANIPLLGDFEETLNGAGALEDVGLSQNLFSPTF